MHYIVRGRLILYIVFLLAVFTLFQSHAWASSKIDIKINGNPFIDNDALLIDERLFVPAEKIGGTFNLNTVFNGETVVLNKEGLSLEFTVGSKGIWVNDKVFCLEAPPQVLDGRIYVPLRFLCETIGAQVDYISGSVEIKYPSTRNDEIVLNFAGDTTLAWSFEEFVGDNFDYPFADASWFGEADITMVNLENPITDRGYKVPKQFNFRMPPKYVQVLLKGGIDIVNLANNHLWDYGPLGVQDTMVYLDEAEIKHVGGGEDSETARLPAIIEIKGKRIGFLGFYFDEGNVEEDVRALKEKADVVIVNFHWGIERSNYPENYQFDLAHRAVDAGADLVIGHHPHVLQGMERYNGGVIAYSLGNFIFGGNSRRQHDTVVFQLTIRGNEKIPAVVPVRISDWQPHWLTGQEGRMVIENVKEYSSGFINSLL